MSARDSRLVEEDHGIHAVTLRVTPCLRIECKFWLADDGWNGTSERPSINIHAGGFEQAKSEMESRPETTSSHC
jgi:hypothetical protein